MAQPSTEPTELDALREPSREELQRALDALRPSASASTSDGEVEARAELRRTMGVLVVGVTLGLLILGAGLVARAFVPEAERFAWDTAGGGVWFDMVSKLFLVLSGLGLLGLPWIVAVTHLLARRPASLRGEALIATLVMAVPALALGGVASLADWRGGPFAKASPWLVASPVATVWLLAVGGGWLTVLVWRLRQRS